MRLTTIAAAAALLGLLSACETVGESGAAVDQPLEGDSGLSAQPPTVPGGGLGGLADDAVVRLQVEDYQTYLDQVVREYRFCVRATALEIDDGRTDPALIVDRAQRRCEDEYRTVHRTANLLGESETISSLRAESQAAAMESVVAGRAPS